MKMKRCLSFVLSVIMAASMMPSDIKASNAKEVEVLSQEQAVILSEDESGLPDNDELFAGYVDELFFGSYGIETYGEYGGERLTGAELSIYNVLKGFIGEVADGTRTVTDQSFSLTDDLGIEKTTWTVEELGLSQDQLFVETPDGKMLSKETSAALHEKIGYSYSRILQYLLVDCPLDFYWYDKLTGSGESMSLSYSTLGDEVASFTVKSIRFYFSVAREYQDALAEDPLHTVDASFAQTAKKAAERAKEIVRTYALYSDYDKLSFYKKEICELVDYNNDAIESGYIAANGYGNPWQLIWVFDGDPSTNVVCEGYSKAFQYLCDLSDFYDENIRCYTVTGNMNGGTGAGDHMWNIVTMDDKKNYIVDVTNCDAGTIGAGDGLFLVGAAGSVSDKYTATVVHGEDQGSSNIDYDYRLKDDNGDGKNLALMQGLYGDILAIAPSKYTYDYVASHGYEEGSDITWTLNAQGFLNIKGSGDMPNASDITDYKKIPWHIYKDKENSENQTGVEINRVLIEEGVASVADWAFAFCGNLEEISLPKGLTKIGAASFAGSNIKTLALPDGLKTISGLAFFRCSELSELEIPSSVVREIIEKDGQQFYRDGLDIGAFAGCTKLSKLTVDPENPSYVVDDGILYTKDKKEMLWVLAGKSGELQIPEGVERIADFAMMEYDGVDSIVIPSSVTYIGSEAFENIRTLKDVWFSGDCPEFSEDENTPITILNKNTVTLHYPRSASANWQPVTEREFGGDDTSVTFLAYCADGEHELEDDYTIDVQPTCTTEGRKSRHCKLCGKSEDVQSIPAGHTYGEWTVSVAPGCTQAGERKKTCSACQDVVTEEIPAIGHAWDDAPTVDKAPTCTEEGKQSVHCANCNEVKDEETIAATGHSLSQTGDHYTCQFCKKTFADAEGKNEITLNFVLVHKENVLVKQITIQSISKKIAAGRKVALSAAVLPLDATNAAVTWESSNTKYATVDAKGVVTTKKSGKGKSVKITAKAADGSGIVATITLKLMANCVTKVQMIDPVKKASSGDSFRLKAVALVNGRKVNNKLKWTSSNEAVATVDQKGRVKIAKTARKGTVTITAMSTDGTNKKAKVKIRIS